MPEYSFFSKSVIARSLAELVVIVVGILMALWVDQWWSDRVDAKTQRVYLAALSEDIKASIAGIDEGLENISDWRDAASVLSNLPYDGPVPASERLIDLLGKAMFEIHTYESRLSAHQDLKNTGRLGLITNGNIRRKLAEVDEIQDDIRGAEADLIESHHSIIDAYLVRHTDLTAVAMAGHWTSDNEALVAAGYAAGGDLIGEPPGFDHAAIVNDREFRGLVAFRIVLLSEVLDKYIRMRNVLVSLQQEIDATLDVND